MASQVNAGWYNDPTGRYSNRYWDGTKWTEAVSSGGANEIDRAALPVSLAPPAPGTEVRGTVLDQPPTIQVTTQGGRSSGGTFFGFVAGAVALLFGLIIVIYAISVNSDDDGTDSPPATEAPADDGAGGEGGSDGG